MGNASSGDSGRGLGASRADLARFRGFRYPEAAVHRVAPAYADWEGINTLGSRVNTRRLSNADRLIGGAERLGPVVMLRPFDMEFGHLALDDAGIGAEAAGPEGFGEDLAQDGVVKAQQVIRGKKDSGR